nr:RHS repeat-associated core domain-containing protein [Candidatus Electrothrix aestuarii]
MSYGYDNSGNIATDITVYDLTDDQRLASVTKDGVTVGAYQYDGRGLRTVKTVNGETSLFIYCKSGKLIAEADSDGNILKEYVYLDGDIFAHFQYEVPAAPLEAASSVASSQEVIPEPVAEQQATSSPVVAAASVPSDTAFLQSIYLLLLLNHKSAEGAYYYINDHLGTPQIITNDAGSVVWQAEYLPFGNVNISVAQIENNLRFPGQYYDAETGLHYNWNRYYDPETGRYIAADPIGLDGGINLYAYVGVDPVNGFDFEGLHDVPYPHIHAKMDDPRKKADAETYKKMFGILGRETRFYPHYETRHPCVREMIDKHEQYHHEKGISDEEGAYKEELKNIEGKLKELDESCECAKALRELQDEVKKRLGIE